MPLKPLSPEAEEAAMMADDNIAESLAITARDKPFTEKTVNALARTVNDLAKLFGADLRVEQYTGPVEQIVGELARYLGMIAQAASDYGFELPMALDAITQDSDLLLLTAALKELAKDAEFKRFLKEAQEEPKPEVMEEEVVEEEVPVDPDALFRSRMR